MRAARKDWPILEQRESTINCSQPTGERRAWPGGSGSTSAGLSRTSPWSTMRADASAWPRCRPRPADLTEGVLGALEMAMSRYQVAAAEVGLLSHATTVVTNAILEESGARAALITTRGFRDVLELRRSARADLYDLFQDAPATLIPRRRRFEITERVGADGTVVTPLAENEIDALIAALQAARVEAIAISLVFSFLNPEHERRLGARLRTALPDVPVYLSSRCVARDQGIRAHQHHRGLRLCRANSRLVSRAAGAGHAQPCAAAALPDGVERRHPRSGRGHRHAGDGRGVGPGSRRRRGRAGGAPNRAARPALVRHGRHHRQGEPDPRRPVTKRRRNTRSAADRAWLAG